MWLQMYHLGPLVGRWLLAKWNGGNGGSDNGVGVSVFGPGEDKDSDVIVHHIPFPFAGLLHQHVVLHEQFSQHVSRYTGVQVETLPREE